MTYLFLDTNIFIHFKSFEDIPWNQILHIKKDDIQIVIAPIVIDELDKHKYNNNQKVSSRIKKLMPKFHEILSSGNSKGLRVQFISERPNMKIFNDNILDKTQQDDCLLASIINFKSTLQVDDRVFYITNDFGPIIKAKSLNIDILPISEDYLIGNDSSEEQKLKKENERLKNLFPKLDIFFNESQNKINEVKKENFDVSKNFIIESKLEALKKEFPSLVYTNDTDNLYRIGALTREQVTTYNKDLSMFFDATENYWSILYDSVLYNHNLIKLDIIIKNIGNVPADDIDIILQFPSDINVLLNEDLDYYHIVEPKPPHKPENSFDINQILNKYHAVKSHLSKKKSVSRNMIEFNFGSLKHNKALELDTLFIVSGTVDKGFKIDYSILVSNIPDAIKGELNVKLVEV